MFQEPSNTTLENPQEWWDQDRGKGPSAALREPTDLLETEWFCLFLGSSVSHSLRTVVHSIDVPLL